VKNEIGILLVLIGLSIQFGAKAQSPETSVDTFKLNSIHTRDICIVPDPLANAYYMISSGRGGVNMRTSKDLLHWSAPRTIYTPPKDVWDTIKIAGIWAPEMHLYKGKYYLFLTFDSGTKFKEQWREWLPRVYRGSQVLVGGSQFGPFTTFHNHSTTPVDMMTLDGTLWVEDGVPYMVFCHEWVQITNGSVCYIKLKDDLSEAASEPVKLFFGDEATWSRGDKKYGNRVTDGPYLYKGKTGKLYMIWTSGGKKEDGMTTGIAISESGKIAGPWVQQDEPIYKANGGHAMLFTNFEGKLMMILHSPYNGDTRPHIFEMEDTGNTLRIVNELKE